MSASSLYPAYSRQRRAPHGAALTAPEMRRRPMRFAPASSSMFTPPINMPADAPAFPTNARNFNAQVQMILFAALVGEVIVPWSVIWLSDELEFDVPDGSLWAIFSAPTALAVLAIVAAWIVRVCAQRSQRTGSGH